MLQAHTQNRMDTIDPIAAEVVATIMAAGEPRTIPVAVNTALTDRRAAERRLVRAKGTISFSAQYVPLSCTLLDICDIGARLEVGNVNQVPDAFKLTVEQDGFAADCVVVWRTGSEVGVVFQSARW